jgi:hypothetical protein
MPPSGRNAWVNWLPPGNLAAWYGRSPGGVNIYFGNLFTVIYFRLPFICALSSPSPNLF